MLEHVQKWMKMYAALIAGLVVGLITHWVNLPLEQAFEWRIALKEVLPQVIAAAGAAGLLPNMVNGKNVMENL